MSKGLARDSQEMVGSRVLKIVIKRKGFAAARTGASKAPLALPLSGQAAPATAQRRKLLEGYPSPSASANAIVSSLRAGWQGLPSSSSELPRWDECLVIPVFLTDAAPQPRKGQLREGKRSRDQLEPTSTAEQENVTARDSKKIAFSQHGGSRGQAKESPQEAVPTKQEAPAAAHQQREPYNLDTSDNATTKQYASIAAALEQKVQQHRGPGSTTSDDQATTTIPFPSPEEPEAATCQQERAEQAEHASAQCTAQQDLRPQRASVACQTGYCALLPPSCLDSSGRSSAAASMSSVTPFELHSPRSARQPADKVDDDFISTIMQKAKDAKYAADKQRGGMTAPWTVEALCKYVQSAIMFMEACEYILRATKDRTGRLLKLKASTVPGLYGSTAKLLSYTANAAETALGPELGKDALRILSERLCALCQLREAVHTQGRFIEASSKALQLSHKFSQPAQHPAEGAAHPTGDAEVAHGQPSPDSMNSSQDVVMASSRAPHHAPAAQQPVQPPHAESIQRLVEQAKQISRFSELIRRSTLGFQTFLERPDYRSNQHAKRVSMHITVVSMDFGCVDGFRVLAHASQALVSIAAMSVA